MKKKVNENCPLHSECGRKCNFEYHEKDCDYYEANIRPGAGLEEESYYEAETESTFEEGAEVGQKVITYIPISELYSHPDNPRKDLGDLSELADSIKAKGILQNLTVVPGHKQTDEEWNEYNKQYGENPSEELKDKINAKHYDDGYTVIIGHRRMAAAKLAGLTELPCVVTEMSPQDQIATMLLENMQRSDLTVYEQAKGFQLMLDFGETIESVAEKSGFSQTTVRRRIKLLDLDEEKFKKSESRGATLFEYLELDKIKNIDLKNKVLDTIGTENFNYELKRAIDQEKKEEYLNFVESEVSKFAQKIDDNSQGNYVYKNSWGTWNKVDEIPTPDDAETVEYFYKKDGNYITLYVKKSEDDIEESERRAAERAEKEEQRQRTVKELESATKRAYELRAEAIDCLSNTFIIKHLSDIVEFYYKNALDSYGSFDSEAILEILGIDPDNEEFADMEEDEFAEYVEKEIERCAKEKPGVMLLKAIYADSGDNGNIGYFNRYYGTHNENSDLNRTYEFLCKLGYEMSDDEKALQDSTHELFAKEENE